ncbi:MAG TPA: ADYC domain-containing protein, partial [Myxococcaceae bacterium]|nr:ADYC domain-containing protein [Myxococcaceae bacterium]
GVRAERRVWWAGEVGWPGWGQGHGRWTVWWAEPFDGAVRLEGTVFHGRVRGREVSGSDFERTRWVGNLGNGSEVELRVDAVTPGTGEDADVWTYQVSYREPSDGRWYPICQDASGRPVEAIPVAGRWDYRQGVPGVGGARYDDPSAFTFACEGAAIAKCIRLGYRPWASREGVALAAHHQACTRLIRADYCGDGSSHTVDGQWVNLYDALGVQEDTEAWVLEAEWDTEGARCFTAARRAGEPVSCPGAPVTPRCGMLESLSTGALLRSETP